MATVAQDEELGSVEKVRLTLNNDQSLDEAVIERKLLSARVTVDSEARGDPSKPELEEAVITIAALDIATSDTHVKQKSADGVSKTWDSAGFREGLRSDKEQALENIKKFFAV